MEHLVLGLPVRSRLRRGAVPTIGVPVNVQPVTKMLVEEAKRSILKVTNNKIISERNSKIVAGNDSYYNPGNRQSKNTDEKNKGRGEDDDVSAAAAGRIYDYGSQDRRNNFEQKMAGMDVLLALGLKPASR